MEEKEELLGISVQYTANEAKKHIQYINDPNISLHTINVADSPLFCAALWDAEMPFEFCVPALCERTEHYAPLTLRTAELSPDKKMAVRNEIRTVEKRWRERHPHLAKHIDDLERWVKRGGHVMGERQSAAGGGSKKAREIRERNAAMKERNMLKEAKEKAGVLWREFMMVSGQDLERVSNGNTSKTGGLEWVVLVVETDGLQSCITWY